MERAFSMGIKFRWEFWSTFQEIPFSREKFRSGRQYLSFHLHSNRKFRILGVNGKQPLFTVTQTNATTQLGEW